MLKLIDNQIKYSFDFCQQCGACRYVCPTNAIAFQRVDNGLKKSLLIAKNVCAAKDVSELVPQIENYIFLTTWKVLKESIIVLPIMMMPAYAILQVLEVLVKLSL